MHGNRAAASSCFIHIGAPKTGTTLLQKILFDNRDELARRSVLYPDVSLRGYGHHDLAFLLSGTYPEWATPQPRQLDELAAALESETRDHDGPVVLSSENFYLFPAPDRLLLLLENARVLRKREPTIVVYLRRQDDAQESWYNQRVKAQGSTQTFEESLEESRQLWNYEAQLERWATVFGSQKIIVRPYEGQLASKSLVEDFFELLSVSTENLVRPESRTNSAINNDLLEFQRLLNQLPLTVQERRRYHHELMALTKRTAGLGLFDEASYLDGERRQEILSCYESGNAAVATKYLGRDQLFLERPGNIPVPAERGGLTPEKLVYILGWLMANR